MRGIEAEVDAGVYSEGREGVYGREDWRGFTAHRAYLYTASMKACSNYFEFIQLNHTPTVSHVPYTLLRFTALFARSST